MFPHHCRWYLSCATVTSFRRELKARGPSGDKLHGVAFLVSAIIVSVVGGLLLRRWEAVLVPVLLVPLYYVGLKSDWWGDGVGDGWQFAATAVTLGTMFVTAIAVVVARLSRR